MVGETPCFSQAVVALVRRDDERILWVEVFFGVGGPIFLFGRRNRENEGTTKNGTKKFWGLAHTDKVRGVNNNSISLLAWT